MSEQELEKLKELQTSYSKLYFEIGELEIQKRSLNETIEKLNIDQGFMYSDMKKLQENESTFAASLNEKYGKGTINITTGEITPL